MIVPGKVQEITLKKLKINLHCLTDVHVGSKVFDRLLFLKVVDKIKKDPNAFWFGNGDMLEFIPPNYHIPEGDQAFDNNEQYEQFVKRQVFIR
jgi:DNA polymerase II small subunit/DNA polymerase delta subunit B